MVINDRLASPKGEASKADLIYFLFIRRDILWQKK